MAALAKSEVHEAIAMSKKTGEPWSPARPPVGGDFQEPAKRQHYWWRFMLATVIIVFSFAGATSASIIHFVDDIAADIKTPTHGRGVQAAVGRIRFGWPAWPKVELLGAVQST